MPTLAPPPPLQMELPVVSFFGRTFDEYARFFALDVAALRRRAVLDVAGGPSSFTAEACEEKIDAVAVDPLYDRSAIALTSQVTQDYQRMFAQMKTKPGLFRLKAFPSLLAAEAARRLAAQRFLGDYAHNVRHGRYVRGGLPRLPFLDGAFDLVLCAHLLFIYAKCFDFQWHLEACLELMRVSGDEVRIHPVCGADGKPYFELDRLRRELEARGIESALVPVDYEFFAGSNSMFVLRRAGS